MRMTAALVLAGMIGSGLQADTPTATRPSDLLNQRGGSVLSPPPRPPQFGDPKLDPVLRQRLERERTEQRNADRVRPRPPGFRIDGTRPTVRQKIIIDRKLER